MRLIGWIGFVKFIDQKPQCLLFFISCPLLKKLIAFLFKLQAF